MIVASLLLLAAAQNDKAQANGRDDAWEAAWVAHCRGIYSTTSKTTGMVLQVGDSITHSNAYSQWPRNGGAGRTAEDLATAAWCLATTPFSGNHVDTANKNGWYLAAADTTGNRGMTASGGLTTAEFLSGDGNGGTAMPATTDGPTARAHLVNTAMSGNLQATTVAAAFADAQFAVLMLGTNDQTANRPVGDFTNDLTAIVNVFEGRNIVVVLSTIPPRTDRDVTSYNAAIRTFAQTRGLPLIDYYAEILARRPGTTWNGTLLGLNDVHPSGPSPAADPYSPGGNAATHQTGTNATNDGYLLRSWLTIQKLKEVKTYVADGIDPPVAPPPPPPAPPGPPAAPSGDDDDDDESPCSCGSARGFGLLTALPAIVLLGLTRRRRRPIMGA